MEMNKIEELLRELRVDIHLHLLNLLLIPCNITFTGVKIVQPN